VLVELVAWTEIAEAPDSEVEDLVHSCSAVEVEYGGTSAGQLSDVDDDGQTEHLVAELPAIAESAVKADVVVDSYRRRRGWPSDSRRCCCAVR